MSAAQPFFGGAGAAFALDELLAALPEGQIREVVGPTSTVIDHYSQDSREVAAGGMFVATRGSSWDGHQFIAGALERGALAIVAETPPSPALGLEPAAAWVQVDDALVSLAAISAAWYGHPARDLAVLATTGTNGKTTTSFLLRDILRDWGKKVGLISTVEIEIGGKHAPTIFTTPPSPAFQRLLASMREHGCTHAVVEASSHGLHQHRIAAFDVAVAGFTNLSRDHLDYHHTMKAYEATKARLFSELAERACICIDHDAGTRMVERFFAHQPDRSEERCVTVSTRGAAATLSVETVRTDLSGLRAEVSIDPASRHFGGESSFELVSPLIGRHNLENALVAVGMARLAGAPLASILTTLTTADGAPGRMQRVARADARGPTCFVDYAHTPDALANALAALAPLVHAEGGRLVCIFGAGGDRDRGKRPEMARVAASKADRVIATSDNPRTEDPEAILDDIVPGFPSGFDFERQVDRRAAIEAAIGSAADEDAVLIAGKGHEPYQVIGTTRHPFDDAAIAAAALEGLA